MRILGFSQTIRRVGASAASVVLLMVALSGCSSAAEEEDDASPWAEEFALLASEASNDFVRAVMDGGYVTRAHLDEAAERAMECFRLHGIDQHIRFEEHPDTGLPIFFPNQAWMSQFETEMPHSAGEQIVVRTLDENPFDDCIQDWFGPIIFMYSATRENPDNLDWTEVMFDCLVRTGVAPEGLRLQEYLAWLDRHSLTFSIDDTEVTTAKPPEPAADDPILLMRGSLLDDSVPSAPGYEECSIDPWHDLG